MKIIGAMSGSSLDGLDLALCSFSHSGGEILWEVHVSKTFEFPLAIANVLSKANTLSVKETEKLGVVLAQFTAECVRKLPEWELCEAVAIHGHTIQHEPEEGYSLQITNPWQLHQLLGKTVVADFRNADIALGGQGAPLVPKADLDLFKGYDAFLNLGGIANATFFEDNLICAYDLFACNQWLNALSLQLGKAYDENGALSADGRVIPEIVNVCLSWNYCNLPAPKSLSNSACQEFFKQEILPFLSHYSVPDVMKSCIEAMAKVIGKSLKNAQKVLVTGGGAYNVTLIDKLREHFHVEIPNREIVEFKEAIAFAYLGFCRIKGMPGNVPEATGASREALLGCLYNF
jgi:anhydro-N-acetylmuramic acid kinase